MNIGLYPGSFDPVTYGHLDIIKRASKICDRLIVAVLVNHEKKSLFSMEERVDMLKESVRDLANVEVEAFEGLTVDFAKQKNANFLIRGLRAVTDFEYELQLSQMNKKLAPEIDTVFLTTSLEYAYLSSSIVKEVASLNGDISGLVTDYVSKKIIDKIKK